MADSDTDTDRIEGTWGERGQDVALRAALWTARLLPYERRIPYFGALARRVLSGPLPYRRRMLENLDFVWPDRPVADRERIADQASDNAGRVLIEHYSTAELSDRMRSVAPTGPGVALLDQARAEGRPVVLMTAHLGNYEAARAGLIGHGVPLGGLYRPMSNPYVNRHYVEAVQSVGGGPLFPQGRAGMGRMLRHLRGGGAAMILNDLYVGSGVEMPFLGKPAMTGLSAAELALKLDALLIPFYGIRQPDGISFRVEVEDAIPVGTPREMTAAYNRSLEARVAADPGQWFWAHRRWKRKWNKGKGAAPGLHPAQMPTRQHKA